MSWVERIKKEWHQDRLDSILTEVLEADLVDIDDLKNIIKSDVEYYFRTAAIQRLALLIGTESESFFEEVIAKFVPEIQKFKELLPFQRRLIVSSRDEWVIKTLCDWLIIIKDPEGLQKLRKMEGL